MLCVVVAWVASRGRGALARVHTHLRVQQAVILVHAAIRAVLGFGGGSASGGE